MEGVYTTHVDEDRLTLAQVEALLFTGDRSGVHEEDATELLNYQRAFEFGSSSPITEELIKTLHGYLLAGGGEYRNGPIYVICKNGEIRYSPPVAQEVPALMRQLIHWLDGNPPLHPVLIAGITTAELARIHPFSDGNGRTAYLLTTLILQRFGECYKQISIREAFDRDYFGYYIGKHIYSSQGNLIPWLDYFCQAVETQLRLLQQTRSVSSSGE